MTDKERVDLLQGAIYEAICIMEEPHMKDESRATEMYRVLLRAIENTKQPEYDDWGYWK